MPRHKKLLGGEIHTIDMQGEKVNIKQSGNSFLVISKTAYLHISYWENKSTWEPLEDQLYYEPRKIKPYRLFLNSLYKNEAPSGYVRQLLCVLLRFIDVQKGLHPDDRITLEASGKVNGSYFKLIQMYKSMGFKVDRTYGENAKEVYKFLKSNSTDEQAFEALQPEMDFVMSASVGKLYSWCVKKLYL